MTRRLLFPGLLAAGAIVHGAAAPAATTFTPPPFPRLGGYLIGSPQNYDNPQYQSQIARLNVAILAVWPGWTGSSGATVQQSISAIKSANPTEIITLYADINELQQPVNSSWTAVQTALNNMGGWLYVNGSGGSRVQSNFGAGFYETNTTKFSATNSSGQHYIDWLAAWEVQTFAVPNPAIDGFYTDNVFWKPRVDGDWNRDGVTDSQNDPTVQGWYREGFLAYFNDLKSQMPGKYQFGNIADWGQTNAVYPELAGQLQGGVMEGMIGYSWSYEALGWQTMLAAYRKMMAAIAAPQLVIFHQNGSPTDYQGFRYGFASCLMDNAYYWFSANNSYSGVNWFDEFNNPLGQSTSQPPTSAWQKGVYRRDFQNGIALVNPKGNGTQTVTLETSYKHVAGEQAPTVNNGQTVTTVTLNDRDGVILLRTSAQPQPDAPQLTVK